MEFVDTTTTFFRQWFNFLNKFIFYGITFYFEIVHSLEDNIKRIDALPLVNKIYLIQSNLSELHETFQS